ncbi:MAG: foldase [Faecalibacterium sp.]
MKKKLLALICALALVFSLVGCTISAPDTVGSIGDFEITSGMYLLAQYGAYQQAAQLAGTDQDTTDVKAFLKETITTDSDSGETAVVSDYVAQKTQETLETLAAVDARFKALGGELTDEQLSAADRYAQQMMDQYGDTYTANGIGLETVKAYERLQVEHTALLDMVYGPDGETPVEDDELTSHLDDSMYEICYISIPLYNTSTYAFADDDQKAEMLKLAQAAADSVNAAGGETVSDQVSVLHETAQNALPDIYAVLDGETSDDSASVQTEPADRKRCCFGLYAGWRSRCSAQPFLRRSRCRADQQPHPAPDGACRPAERFFAGRPAQPDPERYEGRRAGRRTGRRRCRAGTRSGQLCHEQAARQKDREQQRQQLRVAVT